MLKKLDADALRDREGVAMKSYSAFSEFEGEKSLSEQQRLKILNSVEGRAGYEVACIALTK